MLALPSVASAASFSVTPSTGSYAVGDTITLKVAVDPATSTIYTAMLNATFSPDVFEVVSFSMNDSLLPLKMAGYDTIDNAAGLLVKTGGYTGGVRSSSQFGTLILRAKKSGSGSVTVNTASKLLDANDVNQQIGSVTASFEIASPQVPATRPSSEGTREQKITGVETQVPQTDETVVSADVTATSTRAAQMFAAAAALVTVPNIESWIFGILVVILGIGFFLQRNSTKK